MLKGKRVLLVAPKFYIYHQEIINELEYMGADVTFFPEIEHTVGSRIAAKLSASYYHRKVVIPHQRKINAVATTNKFDYVFIIRGGYFDSEFINNLREHCVDAHFVLYQWDSTRQNDYRAMIPYFDEVSTFDIEDSKEFQIDYRPLFYIPQYVNSATTSHKITEFDLCFVGAFHSDRLDVVKFFDQHLKAHGRRFYCHMYITKLALIVRLLTGKIRLQDIKYFKTFQLNVDNVAQLYQRSSAVLDVELNIQSGLSIRTFEVLGSHTKLVTTNKYIEKHSFYNSDIVHVIDRNQLVYNDSFFDLDASNVKYNMECYTLREWLASIFIKRNN
ncbi:hypothetical protein [Vibrio tubiashii]|uniref:hypothetical protein n=1 Tax=Vibrio tubiashii TaxID=29498 RepID=UPI00349E588A